MRIKTSDIAYFLVAIFCFLGVQKITANYSDPCSDRGNFCANATMFVYQPWSNGSKNCSANQIEGNSFSISCETVFISPFSILETQEKKTYGQTQSTIGYKQVIHSTTYINQIDRPPIERTTIS